jgi:hypothetical protein
MSKMPLSEICNRLRKSAKYIVLKVPENFNTPGLRKHVPVAQIEEHKMNKMLLLVLHCTKPTEEAPES